MTDQIVRLGPEYFPRATSGVPISGGSIFIGEPDTDPEIVENQIQVSALQENGTTVPISQPILTSGGGVPLYNGAPVTLLVSESYSLKVLDAFDVQVYNVPETIVSVATIDPVVEYVEDIIGLINTLSPIDDQTHTVLSFYDGLNQGGGDFYWDSTIDKSTANGGIIIDPDTIGGFDGTPDTLDAFQAAQGTGIGFGCWIRNQIAGAVFLSWFGTVDDIVLGDWSDVNAVILEYCLNNYKHVISDSDLNILCDTVTVVQTDDLNFEINGSLYFTGEVTSSYFPPSLDIDGGGYNFNMHGDGIIDFELFDAAIVRRRLMAAININVGIISELSTRSCKFSLDADRGTLKNLSFVSDGAILHQSDATGMLRLSATNGGEVSNNRIIANIDGDGFDIVKVTGGDTTSVSITGNYIENLSDTDQGDFDLYTGGKEASISNNTLINVALHIKSLGDDLVNYRIRNYTISDNKFLMTRPSVSSFIYIRGGGYIIENNFFVAKVNSTKLTSIIHMDDEPSTDQEYIDDQSDFIISGNIVDMRLITNDTANFSFLLSEEIVGTDRAVVNSNMSDNIIVGMNGFCRGPLTEGGIATNNIFDFHNKTASSSGSFRSRIYDTFIIKNIAYIETQAKVVKNSPNVSCVDYYATSAVSAGVLDIKDRDVTVLTAGVLDGATTITGFANISINPFTIFNDSGGTIEFTPAGIRNFTLVDQRSVIVIPFNDINFQLTRIRYDHILSA